MSKSNQPNSGSNPADDSEVDVLEEEAADPVQQELEEASDMRDKHISEYLIGTPKLGDYLEEGLGPMKAECRRWAGQGPQQEQEARC